MNAIAVNNLIKNYNENKAVRNISFEVEKNSFFALLGSNGAGKSTTINILATLLEFNSGHISINGLELGKDDNKIREKVGIVFQNSMLDDLLTVKENLQIRGSFYGIKPKAVDIRVKEINDLLEIIPFYNQKYGQLSGGQKRKADIARALLNWPEILILDEPTTGLDPGSRKDIWELINRLRLEKEITIFLTTHYMEEVHDANKIVVMDKGRILAAGSSTELRKKYSHDRLKILPRKGFDVKLTEESIPYFLINDLIHIRLKDCFEGPEFVEKYRDYIKEFEILRGDMDDVFLNITGRKLESE